MTAESNDGYHCNSPLERIDYPVDRKLPETGVKTSHEASPEPDAHDAIATSSTVLSPPAPDSASTVLAVGSSASAGERADAQERPDGSGTTPLPVPYSPIDEAQFAEARGNIMAGLFGRQKPESAHTEELLAGRFALQQKLGSGGFGTVYRALDQRSDTPVALKLLRRVNAEFIHRFKYEFRTLADILHRNLVTLYELHQDREKERWFFSMELIEGVNFGRHIRGEDAVPTPVDVRVSRVRQGLYGLASGVAALHERGIVHRDLKPSNVLVTSAGRVVILDFGLAVDLDANNRHEGAGTPAFMAPEQINGTTTASCDSYSIGVMLFEALTGTLPFTGTPLQMLTKKQTDTAPDPRDMSDSIPDDLADLCVALLQRDPQARPDVASILSRSQPPADESGASSVQVPRTVTPVSFVGRTRELQVLRNCLSSTRGPGGGCTVVSMHGESGIGKSALLRQFCLQVLEQAPGAVILGGRCYAQESVPYKALDGVVDHLTEYLRQLAAADVDELVPSDCGALIRIFPALQRVASMRQAAGRRHVATASSAGPQQLRFKAAMALRGLLGALARRQPLVIIIDDLQWGDIDSVHILRELLRGSQPPNLLLIASYRSREATAGQVLPRLLEFISVGKASFVHRELPIDRLSDAEARALAGQLASTTGSAGRAAVDAMLAETGGHPFFMMELAHNTSAAPVPRDRAADGSPHEPEFGQIDVGRTANADSLTSSVDAVVRRRLRQLPEDIHRLLELICVASTPLDEALARRSSGLSTRFDHALATLRAARLIRTRTGAVGDVLESYHDRIRETVLANLSGEGRQWHHARIAEQLSHGEPDHESLALHLRAAGDIARAAEHARVAAERAIQMLAFERAAVLYAQALEGEFAEPAQRGAVLVGLGDAQSGAGRAEEAAESYLEAAELLPERRLELQGRAGAELIQVGRFGRGIELLQRVLEEFGTTIPRNAFTSLVNLIVRQTWLRIRGHHMRPVPEDAIPRHIRNKLDVYWKVNQALSMVAGVRGADFQARGLLLALRAGHQRHTALGYLSASGYLANLGKPNYQRAWTALRMGEELGRPLNDPFLQTGVKTMKAWLALLTGRWRESARWSAAAEAAYLRDCTAVWWDLASVRNVLGTSQLYLGDWHVLIEKLPEWLEEADVRGDRFARPIVETQLQFAVDLARDSVQRARDNSLRALEYCPPEGFHLAHFFHLRAAMSIELYAGEPERALTKLADVRWPLWRSLLLLTQLNRHQMQLLEARCLVALAARCPATRRRRHLRRARRLIRSVTREKVSWSTAYANAISAGIAVVDKRPARASVTLATATRQLERCGMALHAAAGRWQRGRLCAGDSGQTLMREAADEMQRRGIVRPERIADMLIPVPDTP